MSNVYFKPVDSIGPNQTQIDQVKELYPKISPVEEGDLVAIKIHPGEYGNTTHMHPAIVRAVVDMVKAEGGIPFVVDTTVLYNGMRFNAADALWTASVNGFTQESMNAPVIIGDGLLGDESVTVETNGEELKQTTVASAIAKADSMIVLSHVKGHPATGFGGAVKNLGMGCLDKDGKTDCHEVGIPTIDPEKCVGCETCIDICAWGALKMEDGKAVVDTELCKGEGFCVDSCPEGAIVPPENFTEGLQKRIGEASIATINSLSGKIGYINWIFDLTLGCDCFGFYTPSFSKDVGILASKDPVAIDMASIDLINSKMEEHGSKSSMKNVWGVDPKIQVDAAEKIGAGSERYTLKK
jgi:hypothetical protein